MLRIVKDGSEQAVKLFESLRLRDEETDAKVTAAVNEIIADVRKGGDSSLKDYTLRFDKCELDAFEVSQQELDCAVEQCDSALITAMKNAAANIREFHEKQKQAEFEFERENGIKLGQIVRGLARVGIYVPGGRAAYPSSVLMNAIPAKVAGVGEIIMVTPPQKDGSINKNILAAAKIAGVDRIFKIGGAQAVAALAYGTETIPKVDKIVGPGNIFVATAKRLLFGVVDIDMIAGPSEILVIADETASPEFLAADLMSQAEHDPLASSILITTSEEIAEKCESELQKQMQTLSKCDIIKESIENYGAAVICETVERAAQLANEVAPEHLEIMTKSPMDVLPLIKNAGSVFLGKWTPEPIGDYYAGTNHVLPTGGTARFFSPLSVDSFVKRMSFISYSQQAIEAAADDVITFANSEGLTAHANSIEVRKNKGNI